MGSDSMEKLIEFTSKQWNDYAIILKYKKASFRILVSSLNETQQKQLKSHHSDEYNITGSCFLQKGNIIIETIWFDFNQYGIPIQLIKHEIRPTSYVKYYYATHYAGKKYIQVQKNGFMVYCAPTGQGKTWFALSNLEELSKQFDTLLYINLELSIDDIKNRCEAMNMVIPSNLYVAPLDNVEVIQQWCKGRGKCMFIIDNIDNLVGGGQDPFGEQLDFIKNLDRFLKDYNHHALVLTQLVKDNAMSLLAKDGEINEMITTNILSGVKQLSYLSRTVMMTAFSPELNAYVYKILKMGSAKI